MSERGEGGEETSKIIRGMGGRGGGRGEYVRGRLGNGGGNKSCCVGNGGKNTPLSGEIIMELVGSPEEEFKLNAPVPAPHIIPFSIHLLPYFHRCKIRLPRRPIKICQGKGR